MVQKGRVVTKLLIIGSFFTIIMSALACAPSPENSTEPEAFDVHPTKNVVSGFTPTRPRQDYSSA